jgi:hypothetical protein
VLGIILTILAAAASIAATPTPAASTAAATPAAIQVAAAKPFEDGDKVVCESTMQTGSHFSSRVCHSKADRAAMEKTGKDTANEFQQRSSSMSLSGK